jgi:hypothetical protein
VIVICHFVVHVFCQTQSVERTVKDRTQLKIWWSVHFTATLFAGT